MFAVNRRTSKKELSKTGGGPPSVLTKNWEKEIYKHCKVNVKGTGIPGIDEPAGMTQFVLCGRTDGLGLSPVFHYHALHSHSLL